jgi:hypothetical protein
MIDNNILRALKKHNKHINEEMQEIRIEIKV